MYKLKEGEEPPKKFCRHCGAELLIEWTLVGIGYYYCFEGCPE